MSSAAAFCETPILDQEWMDTAIWPNDHWYDFGPIVSYPITETHTESHSGRSVPLLLNVDHVFQELAQQWEAETAYLSSIHEMVLNAAYQRIIGLGPLVLPSLLRDLKQTGRFWFWALAAITGENPVPEEELGNIQQMTERWTSWARE